MAFTTLPAAGSRLRGSVLSSLLTEVRPLEAYKTADETVNASATLQDDNELFVTVVANARYDFELRIVHNSGTTPDFKYGFTFPTGTTMRYTQNTVPLAGTAFAMFVQIQTDTPQSEGGAADRALHAWGKVLVSTTAGTLRLQWAQSTSNASDTIVRAGSYLTLIRTS